MEQFRIDVFWFVCLGGHCSRDGLLLLVEPEGEEGGRGDLHDLETDTGQITDGVTGTSETSHKHLVVLFHEGHAAIAGHEASNSLVVLFELHSDALTHSGVRLLGFDTDLFNHDASGVRAPSERFLPLGVLVSLLVTLISPSNTQYKTAKVNIYSS